MYREKDGESELAALREKLAMLEGAKPTKKWVMTEPASDDSPALFLHYGIVIAMTGITLLGFILSGITPFVLHELVILVLFGISLPAVWLRRK